jgi:hypothetical protein
MYQLKINLIQKNLKMKSKNKTTKNPTKTPEFFLKVRETHVQMENEIFFALFFPELRMGRKFLTR